MDDPTFIESGLSTLLSSDIRSGSLKDTVQLPVPSPGRTGSITEAMGDCEHRPLLFRHVRLPRIHYPNATQHGGYDKHPD